MNLPQTEIDVLLRYFPQGVVAIDLETSGLSPVIDKIIEIGCVKVDRAGKVSTFSTLVNPEVPISPDTILIHGITDEMVQESAKIKDILPDLKDFCEDLPLLAHNAKFDLGFILYSLFENKMTWGATEVYCTCQISRKWINGVKSHRLGVLCEALNIPLENAHRASDDAFACLRVFTLSLIKKYEHDTKDGGSELKKVTTREGHLFNLNEFDFTSPIELPGHLNLIEEILKEHRSEVIEIKYSGGSMKNQFRPVKPVSIIPMPSGFVLYALCIKTDLYKNFALKKIKEARQINS